MFKIFGDKISQGNQFIKIGNIPSQHQIFCIIFRIIISNSSRDNFHFKTITNGHLSHNKTYKYNYISCNDKQKKRNMYSLV